MVKTYETLIVHKDLNVVKLYADERLTRVQPALQHNIDQRKKLGCRPRRTSWKGRPSWNGIQQKEPKVKRRTEPTSRAGSIEEEE